jgi:hypothetical protein
MTLATALETSIQQRLQADDALGLRKIAYTHLQALPPITTRTKLWKGFPFARLEKGLQHASPSTQASQQTPALKKVLEQLPQKNSLVFIDGHFAESYSHIPNFGSDHYCGSLRTALKNPNILAHFKQLRPDHILSAYTQLLY